MPAEQNLSVGVGLVVLSRAQASAVHGDAIFGLAGQRRARVGNSQPDEPVPQASCGELDGITDSQA